MNMTIRNSPSWCGKRSASLWPTRTASKDWLLIYDGIPNRCDTYNFTHVHFIHVVMYIYNESVCPHYQCDQYTEYMYMYIQVNAWCYFFNTRNPSFLYEFMLFINDAKLMFYINLLLILRFKKSLVSCSLIESVLMTIYSKPLVYHNQSLLLSMCLIWNAVQHVFFPFHLYVNVTTLRWYLCLYLQMLNPLSLFVVKTCFCLYSLYLSILIYFVYKYVYSIMVSKWGHTVN